MPDLRNKLLYRLNSHSGLVEKVRWLPDLGVDAPELKKDFDCVR